LDARQIANREIVKREIGEKKNSKELDLDDGQFHFCLLNFIMLNLQSWVLDRRWSISFLFVLDGIVFGFNSVS
jgi:hypothetical protein